jgi:hypothetical protein
MTTTTDERLGAALATGYLLRREQFDDADWEPFLRTRRFVDEEVLPVINDYWERAEFPWPLARRLGELGLARDDMGPARDRPGAHGAQPRRRQPRVGRHAAQRGACSRIVAAARRGHVQGRHVDDGDQGDHAG